MKTITRIARTAFLVAVFVAHPRPSLAAVDIDCTPGCSGAVRTLSCTFIDDDYFEGSTFCGNEWACYYNNCCESDGPPIDMSEYLESWCTSTAYANSGTNPWLVLSSCQEANQTGWCDGEGEGSYLHTSGSFYCSFDVQSCN